MSLPQPPLLVITDRRQASRHVLEVAAKAMQAGCRWLSLREKDLPPDDQATLLRDLLAQAQSCDAKITLHGDPTLARLARVDGVHLSAGSDAARARKLLGEGALIGLSIHGAQEARAADPKHLDYVIAGPVYATPSKPDYGPALGPEGLVLIVKTCRVPIIAIGGIRPENVPECLAAGTAGVAVMGAVMRAEDPAEAVAQIIGALQPRPR